MNAKPDAQDAIQELRDSAASPRSRKEILAYFLFWSWNVIFLAFMVLGFAPRLLPELITQVRSGLMPAYFLLDGLALSLIPLAAILLGLSVLRGAPERLADLGYVVEGPLMLILAVRFFAIRQASPGLDVVMGIAILGMAAFTWHVLKPGLDQDGRLAGLLKLAGLTLMLLTALYAAVWILFYAIPVGAELLRWAGRTLSDLFHLNINLRQFWLDLIRGGLALIPLTVLGFLLLLYTASLFVLAPIAVPLLSGRAWWRSLRQQAQKQGWLFPAAAVLLPAVFSAGLFVIANRQPQLQAYALLQNLPASPQQAQDLLAKQDLIRRGLLNSYLAPFRYISAVGEVSHIKDLYQGSVGMSVENARKVEALYEAVALPLLYEPFQAQNPSDFQDNFALQREPDQAAQLYQRFFDTPIAEGEKSEIVRAARSTWSSDQAEAAWQAVDDREIRLTRQEINVSEHGDWADVELYEVYENQTQANQEVIYYFNLPESAALTGLWMGPSPDRSQRFAFQIAPRGAAQQVYRQETVRFHDPALLEQIGPRQYRLRVYPVLPPRIQWDESFTRRLSETPQPMYMWMTYRVLAEDGAWPLPRLAFKNNVYWDSSTVRLVNGQPTRQQNDGSLSGWMPAALRLPASVAAAAPVQAVSHRVDFPGGQSLVLTPAAQAALPGLPAGARLALVLDRSYSMGLHASQVSEAIERLKGAAAQGLSVDVYLTASPFRGENPSIVRLENFDPQQVLYYGGQNPADLLAQFELLQTQRSNNQAADGILVLTDGTAYELGASQASGTNSTVSATQRLTTIPNAPVWMIHLGSDIPLGYDDRTLEAIQASGGGVVSSLDEALSRLALDLSGGGQPARAGGWLCLVAAANGRSRRPGAGHTTGQRRHRRTGSPPVHPGGNAPPAGNHQPAQHARPASRPGEGVRHRHALFLDDRAGQYCPAVDLERAGTRGGPLPARIRKPDQHHACPPGAAGGRPGTRGMAVDGRGGVGAGLVFLPEAAGLTARRFVKVMIYDFSNPVFQIIAGSAVLLILLGLVVSVRRLKTRVWVFAGLLLLAGLASPLSLNVEADRDLAGLPGVIRAVYSLFPALIPSAALVVIAALMVSSVKLVLGKHASQVVRYGRPLQPQQARREAAILLGLSALLVAGILYHLYWLIVWDSTTDAVSYLWLILPVLAAIYSGVMLAINLPAWKILSFLYALLLPAAMIAVSVIASQVDFRQLTQERAGRIVRAIQAYHEREGHYPQSLRQLSPRYLLSLSEPVVLYGQSWCYDGGDDFYRLGYVYRKHWSDPNLIGQVYTATGEAPDLPPICGQEIAALRRQDP